MAEYFMAELMDSWRGAPLRQRPRLLQRMAKQVGTPPASLDGVALAACLYCRDSKRCQTAFATGDGATVETFCTNAEYLRAAAARAG